MLDTSASMTGNLKLLNKRPSSRASSAADRQGDGRRVQRQDRVSAEALHERSRHARASLRELDFGNPTKLYDAIAASIERLREVSGRRVVLVLPTRRYEQRRERPQRADRGHEYDVMIYAVGLRSDYFNGQRRVRSKPDGGLKGLAAETGGGYFELDDTVDLAPTFTKIAHELHTQYVLGFAPPVLDGKVHRVEVRVNRPGVTVRARRSYVATADSN